MRVAPAPFPGVGIDTIQVLDAVRCRALRGAGVQFVMRYLGSLSTAERDVILGEGLGLGVVTYSDAPGWMPSATKGSMYGQADRVHLSSAGIPAGVTVAIDLEGASPDASAGEVTAFLNARSSLLPAGDAGLYVGYGGGLTGEQLGALPYIHRYWRSLSNVPTPTVGWSLMQASPGNVIIGGTQVDVDYAQGDFEGRRWMLLWGDG